LIFSSALVLPINTAHMEDDSWNSKCSRIVEDVLTRGSFRTAIGTVKVQWTIFTKTISQILFYRLAACVISSNFNMIQTAIYLVGRSKNQWWRIRKTSNCF